MFQPIQILILLHGIWKNIKIVVPLKYISNFFRNLELPLINTKLYMELSWTKYSVLCNQNQNSIFQITKGELHIPVVTLNTENNNTLSELLSKGFERTVVWNEYQIKIERVTIPQNDNIFRRTTLDTSFQGVSKLFEMLILRSQEEDIIYLEQKLKTILS